MKQKPDSVFREARSMGFDAKASAVLARAANQPATPPTLEQFGVRIAEIMQCRYDHAGNWRVTGAHEPNRYVSSAELATLVLSLVDDFRAQNRGADEPAESAHR
jgi:hypothetical protein